MRALSSPAAWTLLVLSSSWAAGSLIIDAQWQFLLAAALAATAALRVARRGPVQVGPRAVRLAESQQVKAAPKASRTAEPAATALPAMIPAPEHQNKVVPLQVLRSPKTLPERTNRLPESLSA